MASFLMENVLMGVLDLIFPRKCFGCGKEGRYICPSCLAKVKIPKPVCPRCEKASIDGMTHAGCQKPLGLDGLISIWDYDGAVRKAIISLKYKFAFDIAKELASYIVTKLQGDEAIFLKNPVLVPIPLHIKRENWRGFNQVEEIGKLMARELNWKFGPELLIRKKLTPPQTELKAKARTENIQGVFTLSSNHFSIQPSSHIILLDDVWTTGSTLKEACKVLKRVGGNKIWGLTIAR